MTRAGDDATVPLAWGSVRRSAGVRPRRLRQRERACRDGEGEPRPAHPAAHVSGLRPGSEADRTEQDADRADHERGDDEQRARRRRRATIPRRPGWACRTTRARSSRRPSRRSRSGAPRTRSPSTRREGRLEAEDRVVVRGHAAAVQVTRSTTAASPDPVWLTCRVQPGSGSNESIADPGRDGQLDPGRGRALLLGRDGERELLQHAGLRDGRADRGVREARPAPTRGRPQGRGRPPRRGRRGGLLMRSSVLPSRGQSAPSESVS